MPITIRNSSLFIVFAGFRVMIVFFGVSAEASVCCKDDAKIVQIR